MKTREKTKVMMYQMYNFIKDYTMKNLYPPTILEIADYFNMSSNSSVQLYLNHLKKNGIIEIGKGARAIRLVGYKIVKEGEENGKSRNEKITKEEQQEN